MTEHAATMARSQTRHWKSALERGLKELTNFWQERDELYIEQHADPADQVQSNNDRDMAVVLLNHETRLMHEIESALAKMEDGIFGICEECGEHIPQRRLDVVPWARRCVRCQTRVEAVREGEDVVLEHAA